MKSILKAMSVGLCIVASASLSFADPPSIHSDLPLWTDPGDLSPWGFTDGDNFGCGGRVSLGTWKLTYTEVFEDEESWTKDPEWLSIYNYGVFHCAYGFSWSDEMDDLETAESELGHFVDLGEIETPRGDRNLWLIQSGIRKGSDYVLLAAPKSESLVREFEVLQMDCPRKNIRDAGAIDIFLTRYCAINSKKTLIKLARTMAQKLPVGQLTVIESDYDELPDSGDLE